MIVKNSARHPPLEARPLLFLVRPKCRRSVNDSKLRQKANIWIKHENRKFDPKWRRNECRHGGRDLRWKKATVPGCKNTACNRQSKERIEMSRGQERENQNKPDYCDEFFLDSNENRKLDRNWSRAKTKRKQKSQIKTRRKAAEGQRFRQNSSFQS